MENRLIILGSGAAPGVPSLGTGLGAVILKIRKMCVPGLRLIWNTRVSGC